MVFDKGLMQQGQSKPFATAHGSKAFHDRLDKKHEIFIEKFIASQKDTQKKEKTDEKGMDKTKAKPDTIKTINKSFKDVNGMEKNSRIKPPINLRNLITIIQEIIQNILEKVKISRENEQEIEKAEKKFNELKFIVLEESKIHEREIKEVFREVSLENQIFKIIELPVLQAFKYLQFSKRKFFIANLKFK